MKRFILNSLTGICATLCCLNLVPGISCAQPASKPEMRKTATNLVSFGIPFSIADPDDKYIEVQLYMSKNRGQSWQFYGRQSTAAKEFPFTSNGDGTYWFALRTLDRDRRVHPEGSMNPELEVVVDSVDPELDFRIQPDQAGRLVCRWSAKDEHIDPKTVKLSYRPLLELDDRNNAWMPVSYRSVTEAKGGIFADQYAWWPDTPAREVLVQLQISDSAGNVAVEERQIVVPRTARRSSDSSMVVQGSPMSKPPTRLPRTEVEALKPEATGFVDPNAPPKLTKPSVIWQPGQKADNGQKEGSGVAWPDQTDQRPQMKLQPEPKPDRAQPLSPVVPKGMQPIQDRTMANPPAEAIPTIQNPTPESTSAKPPTSAVPVGFEPIAESNLHSVVDSRVPNISANKVDSVNTKRFRLNYALDQLDAKTIAKVVLWMTYDHGDTWTAYGEDADNESPFAVELQQPGLYGFRIVFHTVDGLAGQTPRGGEDADHWVRLDVEAPTAQITSAPYGRGEQAGSLVIQWTATDDLLSEKPIDLAYSIEPNGPWTNISTGLENSGTYAWKVGGDVPPKVYVRLQATDAAGNSTFYQINQPLDLSGLVPKARILGVEK